MTDMDKSRPLAVMMKYNIKLPEYTYLMGLMDRAKETPELLTEALEILINFKTLTEERAHEALRDILKNPLHKVEKR